MKSEHLKTVEKLFGKVTSPAQDKNSRGKPEKALR